MRKMSQFAGSSEIEPEAPNPAICEDPSSSSESDKSLQIPALSVPREGTLEWLATLPLVEHAGRMLPAAHRCAAGTFRSEEERGKRCAYVRPDGSPCGASATKRYGVCIVHAGGGAQDTAAMGALGTAKLARLRVTREVLGIGPRSATNPRAVARIAAAARAEDIAAALLAPLDARKLAPLERQAAAAVILRETFPMQTTTVDVDLPAAAEDVAGMDWRSLQDLAARMLD